MDDNELADAHLRNLKAEEAYLLKAERDKELYETVEEFEDITITSKVYKGRSSDDLAKLIGLN